MRACFYALALGVALLAPAACAHGPQIQITNDNNKIATRRIVLDEPYTALMPETRVYVMPLLPFNGVWYSRPNDAPSMTIPGTPEFPSGPGLAYGYDRLAGGIQAFEADSVLSLAVADGFKRWDGAAFADAGPTQLKAFRGSNPDISSPPENFAITSDAGPFDSLSLAPIAADYAVGAHSSLRYALLGDGLSATSSSPDGVYLLKLQLSSTQAWLSASEPYYFVLTKNAAPGEVAAAVGSLSVAPALVQWIVPEPASIVLATLGITAVLCLRRRRHESAEP